MSKTSNEKNHDDLELGSANLLNLIYSKRKLIIAICAIAAIISAIGSLMIREKFKSTVTMYAAEDPILGLLVTDNEVRQNLMKSGDKEDTEKLVQLLSSDEVRDRVIEKYNLWKHYGISPQEKEAFDKVYGEYGDNVSINITRYGSVQVEVMDISPDTAMLMANSISDLVDSVDHKMRRARSLQAMNFTQSELESLKDEIVLYEDSMAMLRAKGVYDYYSQVPALTEEYATAIRKGHKDRALTLKIELDSLSVWGHVYNKYSKKIEKLYNTEDDLQHKLDQFTIDLNNTVPVKFIVDEAKVADKKSYPIRWLIVVMSTAAAFFFTLVMLLIMDNLKSSRQ